MSSKIENVSAAKPKVGGAISVAAIGTALPADASAGLDPGFKNLGFCSEDGVVNSIEHSSSDTVAWGGDTVDSSQTDFKDSVEFTLLEGLNEDVLKYVFGEDAVTGNLSSGIKIEVGPKEATPHSLVVDMVLKNNVLKRIVVPNAKILSISPVNYKDSKTINYGLKVALYVDENGKTHYEYIVKPGK